MKAYDMPTEAISKTLSLGLGAKMGSQGDL